MLHYTQKNFFIYLKTIEPGEDLYPSKLPTTRPLAMYPQVNLRSINDSMIMWMKCYNLQFLAFLLNVLKRRLLCSDMFVN